MSLNAYRTLTKHGCDEFVINKSRFIGSGMPCESEEEALNFINSCRQRYRDANHNCYAYIIGSNMGIMRYSDDGEPGGTAGLPIIEVMKAKKITNCCIVVTRYFGGILLGAGGLTRAYSQGAAVAVNACGVGVMYPTLRYAMDISYSMINRIDYLLKSEPVIVEDKTYTDVVTYTMVVRDCDNEKFLKQIIDASEGVIKPIKIDEIYMAWPE